MAFYRRRPRPDAEKCADPAKARASALETLAGQEVSANMLYERLCRRYTEQAAAAAVAEMVQLDYVNDARYAEARAHSLLAARKSRRAAAQSLRQKGLAPAEVAGALEAVYAPEDGDDPELEAAAALVDSRYRKKLAIGRRDLVVAALQRRGFAYPVIKEAIRKDFMETVGERLKKCPMEIRYAFQELDKLPAGYTVPEGRTKPWGTCHAVVCAREAIGDAPFAVINADDYYGKAAFKEIRK